MPMPTLKNKNPLLGSGNPGDAFHPAPSPLGPGAMSPEDTMAAFLQGGNGNASAMHANDAVDASQLRQARASEAQDNLVNDPTNVRLQLISKQLGLDDAADPYSDQNITAGKLADAKAAANAQREMLPEVRAAKTQAMTDQSTLAGNTAQASARGKELGTAQGEWTPEAQNVADANSARKIHEVQAPIEAKFGGAGGSDMIDHLAEKFKADPTYPIPADLKDAVVVRAAQSGGLNDKITNQTRQMSEGSRDILAALPEAMQLAKELHDKGLFQPVIGSARTMLAGHGLGSLMGVDDLTTNHIARFNTLIEAVKSGFARAHAGARGAGNSGMAERFDKLVPVQGDYQSFLGGLQGMGDMLQHYATHTDPSAQNTADPYSNPNWGKQ